MIRRKFIRNSILGTSAFSFTIFNSCQPKSENAVVVAADPDDSNEKGAFQLDEKTVGALQNAMETGEYTSEEIVELYLKRIASIDKDGPQLNAVIELNPDATAIAKELDQERKEGKTRGPMHGIPVLIKDNIDTGDKMMTTAGSLALLGSIAPQDSYVARKLREAGAVILGKTNLSEWANFRSERSSSGWSGRGGQTKNPYVLSRNPCGSSSGSGVAVSANLCTVAIGTETNGSVVCPSSANGIVGIKPTVGLVGRSGIIPISHTQDTAGPMARTVADAVALLGVLTGIDNRDSKTNESIDKSYSDYTQFLEVNGLRNKRIAVGRNFMGFHEKVDALMEAAIKTMEEQGTTIIDLDTITPGGYGQASYDLLLYEFKDGLNKYLANLGSNAPIKSLKELISFNKANEGESMPYFKQEILIKAQEKGDLSTKEYKDALKIVLDNTRKNGIDKVMEENNLDAIIAPTGGPAWPTDPITGDHFLGGSSSPAARAGYPNITVPMGFVSGLPVGISFFSKAYQEPELIKISYAYEQATKHRKPPKFLDAVDLG